jgi:peptidoglycan hydrolase-like protein with peptidoglycan-binding domain
MSKLLKSKILLAFVIVAAVVIVGASTGLAYTHSTTLKQGMSGSQVLALQQTLNVSPATGYFGTITKAAVVAFQASNGLSADGIVGPLTGAVLSGVAGGSYPAGCTSAAGYSVTTGQPCNSASNLPAGCSSTVGYSPTTGAKCDGGSTPTGPLAGSSGEIADINQLSQYSSEEVGSGSTDVKVLGFDVKASKDGDIKLNTIKLTFDSAGNGATESDKIADYLDSLKVLQGSTEVGSANIADFNKDSTGVYSKTITLSNAVVRENTTEKFYVAVDAVSNLDSGDIVADSWTIAINSIRYEDGSGVVTTVDSADALLTGNMDYDAAGEGVPILFVSFSTAADTELKISLNDTPAAGVVKVSTTANTDGVVLLKGKLKLSGTSDVWLDELPITLVTTGDSISALTGNVILTLDGKEFTESTGANCVDNAALWVGVKSCDANTTSGILFDNLDTTIKAGTTIYFTISADMNDLENGATAVDFDEGDTLLASLTTTGRASIVAENTDGDQLANTTEMTGAAVGEAQTFRSTGINLSLVSTNAVVSLGEGTTGTKDTGTFTLTFDVTAFGSDIYVDGTKPTAAGTNGSQVSISGSNSPTEDAIIRAPGLAITAGGTIDTTATYLVHDGETQRFVITSVVTPGATSAGLTSISLASFAYALTDINGDLQYTTDLDGFVTPSVNLRVY